ncbi:MAG: ATP-binding protein [Aggregatilineales bacterium]
MSNSKPTPPDLDLRRLIDRISYGILVFDSADRLVMDNQASRALLGPNLTLIRAEGWLAAAMMLDARRVEGPSAHEIRARALSTGEPVRFHTLLTGTYIPCWAVSVEGNSGQLYTLISMEQTDWGALREFMSTFRTEARLAVESTRGHADLIMQLMRKRPPGMTADQLAGRVKGFAEIIATHMYRLELLLDLLYRLELLRTGQLPTLVKQDRRKLKLAEFVEDFLESLIQEQPFDPIHSETLRDRLIVQIPGSITVVASPEYLRKALHDVLRNAVMYSPPGSPIILRARRLMPSDVVQIDIVDQGCGIRPKEAERVFAPFQRARQPQVMAEFGYGISLYLVKAELDAMGGRIWYESEEGVGTTFSIKLSGS